MAKSSIEFTCGFKFVLRRIYFVFADHELKLIYNTFPLPKGGDI